MSSSNVRLASSIIAHSSPCISMPWPGEARRGRRAAARCRAPRGRASRPAASPGRSSRPRPCAPRRRGPSRARRTSSSCRPRPSRRRCTTRLPSRRSAMLTGRTLRARAARQPRRRARRRASRGRRRRPGAAADGSSTSARAAARAARAARGRGVRGDRARARPRRCAASGSSSAASASVKRSGARALATTRSRPARRSSSRRCVGLVDRHLLRRRDRDDAVTARSASVASIVARLPRDRARPRRPRANVRGASSTATPWPVAGASTTTRSYGSAPGVRRSSCASSQSLPTVSSSRMPGVAAAR